MTLLVVDSDAKRRLELINWIAFTLHFTLALSAVTSALDRGTVTVPVYWPTAQWNVTLCSSISGSNDVQVCPSTETEHFGDVNFTLVLITSQAITCTFHLLQAIQAKTSSSIYIQWSLKRGIKIWHWIEYIVTAPLIAHTILYFSGMLSIQTQMIGYAAQSTLMLIGLLQDVLRHCSLGNFLDFGTVRVALIITFIVGFYNVSSIWMPSIYKLFIDNDDVEAPEFVKYVVLAEFLLYSSFGFAQLAFYTPLLIFGTRDYRTNFYIEELVFTSLSFISKAVLASAFSVCLVYRQC